MRWRRLNSILHRDLGYLCFGLTVIYALSGIAVNHINDWNPNYRIEQQMTELTEADRGRLQGKVGVELADAVRLNLGVALPAKGFFQEDPNSIKVFVEGNTISVNLTTGQVVQEKVVARPVLHAMNFLHLNHPKRLWTWFADLYAVALLLLSVTGIFVLPGKKGIRGRGAWLTALGLAIPFFFLWLYATWQLTAKEKEAKNTSAVLVRSGHSTRADRFLSINRQRSWVGHPKVPTPWHQNMAAREILLMVDNSGLCRQQQTSAPRSVMS